jgi:purine-binding chemotaxis protein CheW
MNLRGEVLAVIDLKKLLGLPQPATESDPAIIVVEKSEVCTGLLVDGIGELVSLARDDFTEEPVPAGKSQLNFFEGAAHWGGVLVSILSLEGLIQSGCCCW